MARITVALTTVLAVLTLTTAGAGAQDTSPLLESQYNCSIAQARFGGQPQPAILGETLTVTLGTECFLVVGVTAQPGDRLRLTYLSGQFNEINLAFYEPGAAPGAAFGDPANARPGAPTRAVSVPGSGKPQLVLIALQGVTGPETGTAAIRIDGELAPVPTTTSVAPSSTVPVETGTDRADTTAGGDDTSAAAVADDDAGFPDAATGSGQDDAGFPDAAADGGDGGDLADAAPSTSDPAASPTDDSLPWWLVALTVLLAGASAAWLMAQAGKRRRGSIVAPWDRPTISWTLQHTAPTGSCSSNARAVVDTTDDGSLDGYAVSALFTLPASGRRSRSTIGDPLLAQLENLWLTGGSGPELRSAVDSFVNNLSRKLDQRGTPTDSTLLVELTKYDVAIDGDVFVCADGEWRMYPHWTQAPGVDADEYAQHNLVQVAALGVADTDAADWPGRAEALTEVIARLIEERRAPVGLWVFH